MRQRETHESEDTGLKTQQNEPPWNRFKNTPIKVLSGSVKETAYLDNLTKICKVLAYIVTFVVVLGASAASKGSLLFMTSQIGSNITRPYCNEFIDRNKQFQVTLPDEEKIAWIWTILFTYFVPEVITLLKSINLCLFKSWKYPTMLDWVSLLITESLPAIGNAILVFAILPELDVIKGVMLTNAVCLVPAIIGTISRTPHERNSVITLTADILSILAQLSALVVWPMIENKPTMWLIPASVLLISVGWWENFVCEGSTIKIIKMLGKSKKVFENSRYFMHIFVSIWKCCLFFVTAIIIILIKEGSVDFLFKDFAKAFKSHTINITEIEPIIGNEIDYGQAFDTGSDKIILADNLTPVWVFLINVFCTYICYIFAKFACKVSMQSFSFAFPLNLTVPTTISILIALCGVHNGNVCAFNPTIPAYLFFNKPPLYFLKEFLGTEHVWIWLIWLLSQTWISIHIWTNRTERLAKTERLFIKPMYDSFLIDQSLVFNRRRDQNRDKIEDDNESEVLGEFELHSQPRSRSSYDCYTPRIYICGTMWHEVKEEMLEFLKSIFRLDEDHAYRKIVKQEIDPDFKDYFKLQSHIFFDDAFVRMDVKDENPKVNEYVQNLVAQMDKAATEVHECNVRIRPPTKYETPYGGRLVWTLPGRTKLIAHLKDSKKIRQKKRWSQVLYMYYLLGYKLMEKKKITPNQKDIVAKNTYLLALDGDIDFQPKDVHLLVDLMKKNKGLGAACGRLHPLGSGPLVWYQIFEYAIGHWLQKATEHVIGCVLCSPGCFSLFRASALMEDRVMKKYASPAEQAREIVQYDLGEDRWLCTLLLQSGYRIEYSAASDAYTHCPEGFNEFYSQRRRWMPSTTVNILDLLFNYKRTIKINDNISRLYILYQIVLLIGTTLGPGTIFLMLVGAFVAVFQMDQWTSFLWNAVPILIFMGSCILFNDKVQLLFAGVISAVYGLVMMAVLIGVLLQISADGILAPSSLFFFCFAGELIVTALFHPREVNCLVYGLVYYVTVPSMYMLLVIFSVFNLNNINWGTRELTIIPKDKPQDNEEENKEQAKPKKRSFNLFGNDKKENSGTFEFSIAGLFKCLCCTNAEKSEEHLQLVTIMSNLEQLSNKLNKLENLLQSTGKSGQDKDIILSPKKETTFIEGTKGIVQDQSVSATKKISTDTTPTKWYDQEELGSGNFDSLDKNEKVFFQNLITKYLFRTEENKAQMDRDLKDLRDKTVMAFFMINALFVLVVFLLTLKKDLLHVNWPLGAKYNFSYSISRREVELHRTPLELEPIGFVFLIFFASLLVVQFIAMLSHRLSTFSQVLANTHVNTRAWLKRNKKLLTFEEAALQSEPVKVVKDLAKLKGDKNDSNEQPVGRRKTVKHLAEQLDVDNKTHSTNDIHKEFERRKTRILNSDNPQDAPRKSMFVAIDNRKKSIIPGRAPMKDIKDSDFDIF